MNKRALIIGGSSGIGLATVKKLQGHGYSIDIIHRDRRQQTAELEKELHALDPESGTLSTYNIDGTQAEKIEECVRQLEEKSTDPYRLVLHALSRGNLKPFVGGERNLNAQDLQLTIEAMGTNLQLWVNQLLSNQLISNGSRLLTLTSEGNDRIWTGYGAVGVAKSALETMCKYLAVELAPFGINVNVIQAGITETPSFRMIPGAQTLVENTIQRNPYGRLTTPEDVANAIYLFTLPEADWINGSLLHVDGGEHLR